MRRRCGRPAAASETDEAPAMEPVIIAICALAAGWVIWKTGTAIRILREQRRRAGNQDADSGNSSAAGIFVAGSTSGHGDHGAHCGGHGDGHGGGDGGGHGGW